MAKSEDNHAISNARAWFEEIAAWVARYEAEATHDEAAEDKPEPLSVEVRSDWHAPGDRDARHDSAGEYCILLSTGGPALRIIGPLDGYSEPEDARLEWQDWGTPWTEERIADAKDVLLTYARSFYFGE